MMFAHEPVKTTNLFAALSLRKEQLPPPSARPHAVTVSLRDSSSTASTTSSTASYDTIATSPTVSSGDKKKRRKKKKNSIATSSSTSPSDNQQASPSHQRASDAKKRTTSIFAVRSSGDSEHDEPTDPSQLSLGERLEIAAAHSDVPAALVGLLNWSRLYANTATIHEFFDSRALALLLQNVFEARLSAADDALFEQLGELLANCLAVERDSQVSASSARVAHAVAAAARAVVNSSDRARPHDAVKAAQYLSHVVLRYRTTQASNTNSSTNSSSSDTAALAHELQRIDKALVAAAAKDSAVHGQSIRETFTRRDIRCDALTLYEARLAAINAMANGCNSADTAPADNQQEELDEQTIADSTDDFAAFVAADEPPAPPLDMDELASIQQQLVALRERQAAAAAPLVAEREIRDRALDALTTQRAALEAQLRALNRDIDDVVAAQLSIDEQLAAVDAACAAATAQVEHDHAGVLDQFEREQQRVRIAAACTTLGGVIAAAKQDDSDSVDAQAERRATCVRQHLEGVLRYFASELPCVQFMRARVATNESQRNALAAEADGYKALGVSAVAKELLAKASELARHIDEDRACLAALQLRDVALLETVRTLLADPANADAIDALDPALLKDVQRHVEYVAKLYTLAVPVAVPEVVAPPTSHDEEQQPLSVETETAEVVASTHSEQPLATVAAEVVPPTA